MRDRAFWSLLGSNLLTLAVALWQEWPLIQLLWPYWLQSVVIGWYARRRIVLAPDYRIETVIHINDARMRRGDWPQKRLANFFAMHFGVFHLAYLTFLTLFSTMGLFGELSFRDWQISMALTLPFVFTHRQSHREHVETDLASKPTAMQLMGLPYLRVVPMHVTLVLGIWFMRDGDSSRGVALFAGLKTLADLGLHVAEHRRLQRARR